MQRSPVAMLVAKVRSIFRSRDRRLRRLGRIVAVVMRRVSPYLIVSIFVVGLICAILFDLLDRAWKSLSTIEIVALGVIALLVVRLWAKRRPIRILPFRSVASDKRKALVDGIASALAEELDAAMHRIQKLVRGEEELKQPIITGFSLDRARPMLPKAPRGESFRTLATESGGQLDIATVQAGTVDVGPLRVPVALLANIIARLAGRAIRGEVIDAGEVVRVAVKLPGRDAAVDIVEARMPAEGEPLPVGRLALDMAYRVVWSNSTPPIGADACSFRSVLEGLASFIAYRHHGNLGDLDTAERLLLDATTHSPEYAHAFHLLGEVQYERWCIGRIYPDVALGATADISAALNSWRTASRLDPTLVRPRLALAHQAEELRDPDIAITWIRALVSTLPASDRDCVEARYWLGISLGQRAMRSTDADPGQAYDDAEKALNELHDVEQELRDQYACARASGRSHTSLVDMREQLAQVLLDRGHLHELRADLAPRLALDPQHHENRAVEALHAAVRFRPERPETHEEYGSALCRSGRVQDGARELLRALAGQPHTGGTTAALKSTVRPLSDVLLRTDDAEKAKAGLELCRVALVAEPRDPYPWRVLSEYAGTQEEFDTQRALLAVALALPPLEEVRTDEPSMRSSEIPGLPSFDQPDADREARDWLEQWREDWLGAHRAIAEGDSPALQRLVGRLDERYENAARENRQFERLAAHELGVLHTRLALDESLPGSSRDFHASRARPLLDTACSSDLPYGTPVPPAWVLDLADVYADLLDKAEDAVETCNKVLKGRPPSLTLLDDVAGAVTVGGQSVGLSLRARALATRGAAHYAAGRDGESMRDCRDAIRLEPTYAYPYTILADLYKLRGQYDQAADMWHKVADLVPVAVVHVHHQIGELRKHQASETPDVGERRRLLHAAIAEYRHALARDPNADQQIKIRTSLAESLCDVDQVNVAITQCHLAVELAQDSEKADLHGILGDLYIREQRFPDAERQFREAMRCAVPRDTPADNQTRRRSAWTQNDLSRFLIEQCVHLDEAQELASSAIEAAEALDEPELLARCLDTRGWAHFRAGHTDKAIADLDRAVAVSVGNSERWAHLAIALEARKAVAERKTEADRARQIWSHVAERYPDSPYAETARERLAAAAASISAKK